MSEELLCLNALSYAYEEGTRALADCSLRICEGEKIAVLGGNGAGKSTLFLLLNGVLSPKSGQILYEGQKIGRSEREKNRLRRGVGLVFQDPELQFLAGTVEEEISFGPMNLDLAAQEVRRRVEAAIEALSLESLRLRPPHALSGGEARRVAIASVLAMEPRILLLDEPAAFLDAAGVRDVENILDQLHADGLALLVATHDLDFAWRWATRVLLFHEGVLLCDGSPEAVFTDAALLRHAGLEAPLFIQVGEALGLSPLPRTRDTFLETMKEAYPK